MPVFFSFFALFKMRCLSLNLLSLQTTVRGRSRFWPVFVLRGPILWHLSISMSLIFPTYLQWYLGFFFSHASHVSLGSSFTPSIQRLFLQDLSSNSINFADTSSAFNRSSFMALTSVFKFLISFFTWNSSSSIFFCVNSKLAVKSTISADNLSRRSVVLFTLEFISSLIFYRITWVGLSLNTGKRFFLDVSF